jgi:cellulose synthase/poly-beta-1,6-N-acetylglucosamine synthase-like glycosyltransferase
VVLVPAHNEAHGIAATITSIREQLLEGDGVLVVADNCSDTTAAIALHAGASVLERYDHLARGKSYALDYGVRHLAVQPPEMVIIIDADCMVMPGAIDRLARLSMATQRPVQALYLMQAPQAPLNAGLKMRIAEFAWIVKNQVRPLGFHRLGLPCQLMGTGMAFPWTLIGKAALATGHLAEDMKLGIELARANAAPLFCQEAGVISYFPVSEEAARTQRTRWEHGHMSMILSDGWRLLARGIAHGDRMLIALALDMCVPPVALLTLVSLGVFLLTLASFLAFDLAAPVMAAGGALLALGLAVLLSWRRFGQHVISLKDLFSALGYAFWKVPLYLKFVVSRQVEWVRSKRDAE